MSHIPFRVLHAGALRRPIGECAQVFRERYPHLAVELESAGSRECAARICDGGIYDVVALADTVIFERWLVPEYVDRYFVFATDQIVVAFDRFSRRSREVGPNNWMDVLLSKGVIYGRSDHQRDPCGYRTLMVWQLAEKFYNRPGLYAALDAGCSRIYPKSIDLAGALVEGRVDYGFLYSSVARQLGLHFVRLASRINLSHPALVDYYATAGVVLEEKGSGKRVTLSGAPIEFAVAPCRHARYPEEARWFVELLTGERGRQILEACGLVPC
ncbi:molybdenum ABC transporter substrate-binding protein [Desulfofundulus thermobenzoicus]|uniref:Molybdenum ABC transporter substrate-binding protein n=1 Tax=Desulfofundulus thermobenzoicus TaxID=29376 RepID=A0A6N7INA5_9FIRM|nr:extracellular solute-binding protein [Desulfofundulus thermobenzoicus]MQL51077.1 molybdenum ABC transporter substrate-binding protein [Desulfofundulus thermobenzoicus]HHW44136.1 solute-binding protein [Desulfotomaculum sp.]